LIRCTFDQATGLFPSGSVDLLHIDGLHTYEAARHDFETWLPKMSPRGVVLLHGTALRGGDAGVWRLWEEISRNRPHFLFEHGQGLGVLGVGSALPEAVFRFFNDARNDAALVRAYFALPRRSDRTDAVPAESGRLVGAAADGSQRVEATRRAGDRSGGGEPGGGADRQRQLCRTRFSRV